MKKILTIILILFTFNVFAQEPIVGNWKFTLDHKIDVKDLIKEANKLGATFSDDDINFVYGITVIYVLGRCENSEIMISDFENTVLITTENLFDPTIVQENWGKWEKIEDGVYRIIMDSGEEEYYSVNEVDGHIRLSDSKYQEKIITKLLANNLMLIKK